MNKIIDRMKAAIAEKFAPAVDFRAPYAKVMLDAASRGAIEIMIEHTEAMIAAGMDEAEVDGASEYRAMMRAALKD